MNLYSHMCLDSWSNLLSLYISWQAVLGPRPLSFPLLSNSHKEDKVVWLLLETNALSLHSFWWVSRMCGREVWSYGRWYGSPVRTTRPIYAQYSSSFFWWSTHLLLVAHVRTRPYTRPIFAPWTIFSQTLPNPSSDQSKSLLDLSSQDNYFRTLLKLDWTLLDIF